MDMQVRRPPLETRRIPTVLHLGVNDVPYAYGRKSITTYQVAKILERNYGVMQMFWDAHGQDVAQDMEGSLKIAFEAMLEGRSIDPYRPAMAQIQTRFRRFISTQEVERMGFFTTRRAPNGGELSIPTKAALRGVNHRLARPYAITNPRRPSFRDTGTYETHFQAWTS